MSNVFNIQSHTVMCSMFNIQSRKSRVYHGITGLRVKHE